MNTEINDGKTDFLYTSVTSEADRNDSLEISLAYKLFLMGRLKKNKGGLFKGGALRFQMHFFLRVVFISALRNVSSW